MEAIRNLKFIISVGVGIAMLMATIGVAWGSTTVSFSDFTAANLGNFQLNGDTAGLNPNSDNVLRLTTNQNGQAGKCVPVQLDLPRERRIVQHCFPVPNI